jgi:hypothetical protein
MRTKIQLYCQWNKNQNIHIKLEISRDPNTGSLNLMTRFDPNAPNFIRDENGLVGHQHLKNESFSMKLLR